MWAVPVMFCVYVSVSWLPLIDGVTRPGLSLPVIENVNTSRRRKSDQLVKTTLSAVADCGKLPASAAEKFRSGMLPNAPPKWNVGTPAMASTTCMPLPSTWPKTVKAPLGWAGLSSAVLSIRLMNHSLVAVFGPDLAMAMVPRVLEMPGSSGMGGSVRAWLVLRKAEWFGAQPPPGVTAARASAARAERWTVVVA